jgi:hypothetical protein
LNANPLLKDPSTVVLPRWDIHKQQFADGSEKIRDAFLQLATLYGSPEKTSPVIGRADTSNAPDDDIFRRDRDGIPDIGCVEYHSNPIQHLVNRPDNDFITKEIKWVINSENQFLKIILNQTAPQVTCSVYSLSGKLIMTQMVTGSHTEIRIPMKTFGKLNVNGVFIVEISSNTFTKRYVYPPCFGSKYYF